MRALVRNQFVEQVLVKISEGLVGAASGRVRFNIVTQKILQLRIVRIAMRFMSRSAVSAWLLRLCIRI